MSGAAWRGRTSDAEGADEDEGDADDEEDRRDEPHEPLRERRWEGDVSGEEMGGDVRGEER